MRKEWCACGEFLYNHPAKGVCEGRKGRTMREPEMPCVRILTTERLRNSKNGNPRFIITFYDMDSSYTYMTQTDAAVNYEVSNYANSRERIDVWLTQRGMVEFMAPAKQGRY